MSTYHLASLFERVADAAPDAPALVAGDRRFTYGELDREADRVAGGLAALGVTTGTRVAVHGPNRAEWVTSLLAVFKLRAVVVPVNHRYTEAEARHLYRDAGAEVVLADAALLPVVRAAANGRVHTVVTFGPAPEGPTAAHQVVGYDDLVRRARPTPRVERSDDDLYVIYTGGTTGDPKGVVWRHEDIFMAALGGERRRLTSPAEVTTRGWAPHVRMFACGPLAHGNAQWITLTGLLCGACVVVNVAARFDPAEILQVTAHEGVTVLCITGDGMGVPLADALDEHPDLDLSALRRLNSGGATLSGRVKDAFARRVPGLRIVDGFGASETGALGTGAGADGATFELGPSTAVLDDGWRPVEPGSETVGWLARWGHVPLRYHGDPEKSAATFREVGGRRWVRTGDQVRLRADGTVELLGRGSSCINTGGEKVYPTEVERCLLTHPLVTDAVVVGLPHERWGETVAAVVAATVPVSTVELEQLCRHRLAGYKVPRTIRLVRAIERSDAGKPDHAWARSVAVAAAGVDVDADVEVGP